MKSRPIMFSTLMIQALPYKSQTRRTRGLEGINEHPDGWKVDTMIDGSTACFLPVNSNNPVDVVFIKCPYGVKGDRLWCKETFKYIDFCLLDLDKTIRADSFQRVKVQYKSDLYEQWVKKDSEVKILIPDKWRSAMFMPRWASRHLLELIEEPIPQRLWDITEEDAIAEGAPAGYIEASPTIFDKGMPEYRETPKDYRRGFQRLWDLINGKKYPWSGNFWDWKIVFKEIKQ